MKQLLLIFIFCSGSFLAQDKLFFTNGRVQSGILISIAKELVYFKNSDTSKTQQIKKTELVMIETYKGERYLFAKKGTIHHTDFKASKEVIKAREYLGVQPFAVFLGRFTVIYEHLSKNGKLGLAIPLSLTFDPVPVFYSALMDTSVNAPTRAKGLNFIIGGDLNFYFGKIASSQFFMGPRIRYGTDQLLFGTEGYSLQTQFGWKFNSVGRFTQHLSAGFGFVRILSSPAGSNVDPKQSYGWFSINYRMGWRW